jgi:uncharacterized membrane protein YkvA (DUF1232 family)
MTMSSNYPEPTKEPAPGDRRPAPISMGFFKDLINELRLTWRLFRDPRVPIGLKLIPPTALLYTLSPVDLIPDVIIGLGQLDDLAVLVIGMRLFVEVCPPDIVHEHRMALARESGWTPPDEPGDVVDGSWKVVDPHAEPHEPPKE